MENIKIHITPSDRELLQKSLSYALAGLFLCVIAALIIFLSQVKQTNKYYKLACIQSDIIRNYHDSSNTDIYNVAQDYLGIIGMDTNTLEEYSYYY